jgi:hypothetical protein
MRPCAPIATIIRFWSCDATDPASNILYLRPSQVPNKTKQQAQEAVYYAIRNERERVGCDLKP